MALVMSWFLGYQGRVERSHHTDDKEFYIPCLKRVKSDEGFLRLARRWQYYYPVERPRFGAGMGGKDPDGEASRIRISNYLAK